jgi:hypothetical protein
VTGRETDREGAPTACTLGDGERVIGKDQEPQEFYGIKRAHHNDPYMVGGQAYMETLNRFLSRVTGDKPSP